MILFGRSIKFYWILPKKELLLFALRDFLPRLCNLCCYYLLIKYFRNIFKLFFLGFN